MTAFTPGPWEFHYQQGANTVLPRANDLAHSIAMQLGDGSDRQYEANARLIAAAPDMYQALRELLESMETPRTRKATEPWERARSILSTIEGK